VQPRTSC